jgi:hypothetical protein
MSSLKEYREQLDCSDETERTFAAEDIGYLNCPEGVPVLLERLAKEPSLAVRGAIFQALIRIEADAAIEGSIGLLESEDPQIRNQAVDVLRRKGARSIPFLKTVMRDGDRDVRKLVLDVLREIPSPEAGELYAAALRDKDPNVVITAVENLGGVRAAEFRGRIEDLLFAGSHPMLVAASIEALAAIADESSLAAIRRRFPRFTTLPDFFLAPCLKVAAAAGGPREFAEVAGLLAERGPHLRPAILGALIAIRPRCGPLPPDEDFLAALKAEAGSGVQPLCRYQAVRILGFWAGREDVCAFLASCLSRPERLVRLAAAEAFQMSGLPGARPLLAARAFEESDEEVRQALGC